MRKTVSIILLSTLVFFTPILFGTPTYEIFEFPKMIFVYLLGGVIVWIFLAGRIWYEEKVKLPSREILAFVIAYTLSTLMSTHIYTSVWGYYKRFNGGLISVLLFTGLFIVLINELKRNQIKELINYVVVASIPASLYSIFQHYSFISSLWGAEPAARSTSTFGQPNWLAAFLVVTGLIALRNFLCSQIKQERLFWACIFVLNFWGMWVAYSLSGILGFVIGVVAFFLVNKNEISNKLRPLILLFIITFVIAVTNLGIFDDKIRDIFIDIKKVHAQEEFESVSNNVSDPGYIRSEVWLGTLKLTFSEPKVLLIGTGPETFPYAFQNYRPADLNYSSEWNFVFNKPHNYYLELLSNVGLLGLVSYLLILNKSLRSGQKAYVPALLGLYVTNLFGWPTVATTLVFWLLLAEQEVVE